MDFIAKGTEVAKETEVIQVSEVAKGTVDFRVIYPAYRMLSQ